MFKQVNRRFVAALMAMAVVISNVITPVAPAFATDKPPQGDKQVYCNIEGNSGKWKAQIGGKATEHEFPLTGVSVHDQSDLKDRQSELDAQCALQYGVPSLPELAKPVPTPATCQAPGSLTLTDTTDYTWSTNPATNSNIGPGTYDVTATIRDNVNKVFSNRKKTVVFNDIVVQAQLSGQACPPAPKVEYSNWSYGIVDCSALQATQTRIKTVTPYVWSNQLHKWVLDVNPFHTTVTTETQQRDLTSTERMLCTPKPKDTVVYGDWTDGTYKCGDTTVDRTREATTTKYTWNGSEWVANVTTKTEHKSRPATTEEQMSCASQTQPTCETDGTLTLPAYKGDWHKDYKYVVTIGLSVKTYDAGKTVTIKHIPQGATVTVKLVSDDCFHDVIFTKDYTFNFADCIAIPEPQQIDECGPDNAHWIVPADTKHIHWSINGNGHLIATAVGGHFTNGKTTIDYGVAEDSNEACPPIVVAPVKPQITDCEVILPITAGITYKHVYLDATGNIVDPNQAGIIATQQGVVATAKPGYVLAPSNDGGKYLDNGSYLYILDFTGLNCGKGDVTPPTVTPPATTTSAALPTPAELPHTGSSLNGLLVTLLATLTTYGAVYFLQPKRR